MINDNDLPAVVGSHVTDTENNKIGTVGQLYVDPRTGAPNWATVKTGLFGTSESFVPLESAEFVDGTLRVPYSKDVVKAAPRIDTDRELDEAEENELYAYYQRGGEDDGGEKHSDRGGAAEDAAAAHGAGHADDAGGWAGQKRVDDSAGWQRDQMEAADLPGATEDQAAGGDGSRDAAAGQRSGEGRARESADASDGGQGPDAAGADTRAARRARERESAMGTGNPRLRKYVVTEVATVEVPVKREEVRLEEGDDDR